VHWARLKERRAVRIDPATKAALAAIVVKRTDHLIGLTAAKCIGDEWPRVSELRDGKLERFSVLRLLWFLRRLGDSIEIRVVPGSDAPSIVDRPGEIRVIFGSGPR
jgi:predicted XRE-type DNA-binding protein